MDSWKAPKKKTEKVLKLSEASPTGKIWDKHRANAENISEHYAKFR
ncbi:hypothetical protein NIES4071_93020 [Calothrix sp. NIES-4071]|nr:hypothetical protein NIES4071_93020 [Calothrix sp. NIES-4071]BAZ63569.1 hypothetical protein NIES4105_92950 [Calothrix sp. NIES-4105]